MSKSVGRPKKEDKLVNYTFKIDADTVAALERCAAFYERTGVLRGGKAQAIRRAIHDLDERLRAQEAQRVAHLPPSTY